MPTSSQGSKATGGRMNVRQQVQAGTRQQQPSVDGASLLGGELGGVGEGVVHGGVVQMVHQVLNGALAGDNGLQYGRQCSSRVLVH
jgi:hypothetical protein